MHNAPPLDGHSEERPISAQPYLEESIEPTLDKPLWRLLAASRATHWWCMPNNDDDDDDCLKKHSISSALITAIQGTFSIKSASSIRVDISTLWHNFFTAVSK